MTLESFMSRYVYVVHSNDMKKRDYIYLFRPSCLQCYILSYMCSVTTVIQMP